MRNHLMLRSHAKAFWKVQVSTNMHPTGEVLQRGKFCAEKEPVLYNNILQTEVTTEKAQSLTKKMSCRLTIRLTKITAIWKWVEENFAWITRWHLQFRRKQERISSLQSYFIFKILLSLRVIQIFSDFDIWQVDEPKTPFNYIDPALAEQDEVRSLWKVDSWIF